MTSDLWAKALLLFLVSAIAGFASGQVVIATWIARSRRRRELPLTAELNRTVLYGLKFRSFLCGIVCGGAVVGYSYFHPEALAESGVKQWMLLFVVPFVMAFFWGHSHVERHIITRLSVTAAGLTTITAEVASAKGFRSRSRDS